MKTAIDIPESVMVEMSCSARHGVEVLERNRHFAMIEKALGKLAPCHGATSDASEVSPDPAREPLVSFRSWP
jgi:hypothetical protein